VKRKDCVSNPTAVLIAKEYAVSPRTMDDCAKFARQLNAVAANQRVERRKSVES
jgi:hypothetical protein